MKATHNFSFTQSVVLTQSKAFPLKRIFYLSETKHHQQKATNDCTVLVTPIRPIFRRSLSQVGWGYGAGVLNDPEYCFLLVSLEPYNFFGSLIT